jgi:hypothetical protein
MSTDPHHPPSESSLAGTIRRLALDAYQALYRNDADVPALRALLRRIDRLRAEVDAMPSTTLGRWLDSLHREVADATRREPAGVV